MTEQNIETEPGSTDPEGQSLEDAAAQAAVEREQEAFREAMLVAQARYFERRTYELAIELATSA